MQDYDASEHTVENRAKPASGLIPALAAHLRDDCKRIAAEWAAHIQRHDRSQPPRPPSTQQLDGMPLLVEGIAWYLEHPNGRLSIDAPVVRTAMELGKLRHTQGYSAEHILAEYELLGRLLFHELCGLAEAANPPRAPRIVLRSAVLLFHAVVAIERTTTAHFLALARARVNEREERLRAFNRAVSHEIKNRIGTVVAAGQLLKSPEALSRERQQQFADMVTRNAQEMAATVENLLVLARLDESPRAHRKAPLRDVIDHVLAQCHDSAQAAAVDLAVVGEIPDVDVADGAWYLALLNYVRNAIKYRNPDIPARHVRISAAIEHDAHAGEELVIRVADNGLGVPADKRGSLFTRFFRAHAATHAGTGLGLSIVREAIQSLGGRAWAEFPAEGSVFCIAMPLAAPHEASPLAIAS